MKKISEFDTRIRLYKHELEVFEENVYSQPLTPMTPRGNYFLDISTFLYYRPS